MKFNLKPNFGVFKMLWTFKLSSRYLNMVPKQSQDDYRRRYAEELTSVEFVHLSHVALIPRRDS